MTLAFLCLSAYIGLLALLSIYGVHRTWLLWRLARQPLESARRSVPGAPGTPSGATCPTAPEVDAGAALPPLPFVTVQLPVFNERYVIERLIDAACALDYPADRLEVQVLDDSTDETAALAAARVAWHRAQGRHVVHLRRPERRGFKAGALEAGLKTARGELIAVFDADFVPAPDFLRRCVDAFVDPEVGMVQARWGHLNAAYSTLTRAQAALLDGHFLIEHASRHAAGHFFNFNGTAGIWRRACIESAGGWQHDTLTEDLDLSYRAQLNGWRFLYRGEVVAPAELPVEMTAFKGQQRRWAKGSIQTGIKLLPRILCSRLPVGIKLEAFFHLTSNLCYLWMVLLALLLPAAVVARAGYHGLFWTALDAPLFLLSLLSVTRFYVEAQRELEPGLRGRLLRIPVLMALGIGMALSNGLAVLEALFGVRTPFLRTPKHRIERRTDRPVGYHSPGGMMPLIELAMAAYLMAGMGLAMRVGMWWSLPFMALFVAGYLFVGLSSMPGWRAAGATP